MAAPQSTGKLGVRLAPVVLLMLGIAMIATLSGCGQSQRVREDEYSDPRFKGPLGKYQGDGSLFNLGTSGKSGGQNDGSGAGLGVNAYLWRGTLDTLSFMPLVSADPFGGVVITDWYQPPSSQGERFKATAYILGRQLRADGVKVSIFRQVSQSGQWVDAAVNPSVATELENKVLERARALRGLGGS